MDLETKILSALTSDIEYTRKVLPYIKNEYFKLKSERVVFTLINSYFNRHKDTPTSDALRIEVEGLKGLTEPVYEECTTIIDHLGHYDPKEHDWLVERTEAFCQERGFENALQFAVTKMRDDGGIADRGEVIPRIQSALGIAFDPDIGHDYLSDIEQRYKYYSSVEEKIPFDLSTFNEITRNGLARKTLLCLMGGVGGGKTLSMCHFAAAQMVMGYNVLYISMEMSDMEISKRIDANLADIELNDLIELGHDDYMSRMSFVKQRTKGQLKVKQYPTAGANVNTFRSLLNELHLKKGFVPDVIYVDYLNIAAAARFSNSGNIGSYQYVKAIAEELRGLAVEYNVAIVTATQVNRAGFGQSDMDMDDVSESWGLPATVDYFLAIVQTDEMAKSNQIMFKQLKNRYGDERNMQKFMVGIEKAKMRLYDLERSAQFNIGNDDKADDTPVFDKGELTEREDYEGVSFSKYRV